MHSLLVVSIVRVLLAVAAAGAGGASPALAFVLGGERSTTTSLTIEPEADARVEEAHPDANFGADAALRADGGDPEVRSYLRFHVSGVTRGVSRATLRLYSTSATEDGPPVYKTDNDWSERQLTWDARPVRTSEEIDDAGATEAEVWVDYDVTSFVAGDGTYSFVLIAERSDGIDFSSREGERSPRLVLTLNEVRADDPGTRGDGGGDRGDDDEAVTVVAVGDIACDPASGSFNDGEGTASNCRQKHTADLVERIDPELVLGLGDMQYEEGTLENYVRSYDRSWGRFKDKTFVVAGGSHDFYGGGDFYEYWGDHAGPGPLRNWHSMEVGAWHVVFLNSYCDESGGCDPGSEQYEWLRADLAASDAACTLALWHEPRYSSDARHGDNEDIDPFWDLLYEAGAELVLVGNAHDYERFAPINADGERDDAFGVRQFVVGTGGKSLEKDFGVIKPESEVRQNDVYGVLKLTLRSGGYDWEFVPEAGKSFTDTGSAVCHGTPKSGAGESGGVNPDADEASHGAGWTTQIGPVGHVTILAAPATPGRTADDRLSQECISIGIWTDGYAFQGHRVIGVGSSRPPLEFLKRRSGGVWSERTNPGQGTLNESCRARPSRSVATTSRRSGRSPAAGT